MADRDDNVVLAHPLSFAERKTLQEFLGYIELRVRTEEPFCAYLIRMAQVVLVPVPTLEGRPADRIIN